MNLLHLVLSAATRLASFQLFHSSMRLSFSIVDRHVVFGRPTFLPPSGVQVNAVSHLLFLSIRRICPTHFHLLNLTSVLIVFNFVFARISRFDTTYSHRICRIRFKHLKKNVSNFLLSPSLIFHVSLPYNNTGLTSVLKSLNLDLNMYIFELHICFSFMKDCITKAVIPVHVSLASFTLHVAFTSVRLRSPVILVVVYPFFSSLAVSPSLLPLVVGVPPSAPSDPPTSSCSLLFCYY